MENLTFIKLQIIKNNIKSLPYFFWVVLFFMFSSCNHNTTEGPFLATGIKIGEVTQSSAIVWVRLTKNRINAERNNPMPEVKYKHPETGELIPKVGRPDMQPVIMYPDGYTINTISGATPGHKGMVRLRFKRKSDKKWKQLAWHPVNPNKNFTHQFEIHGLLAGEEYDVLLEGRKNRKRKISHSIKGQFKTPPDRDIVKEINFFIVTCTAYGSVDSKAGYKFYNNAQKLAPEFFVHTGDVVYYDRRGKTSSLARWHWDRMYSYPIHIEFHKQITSYFMKDDHDTWMNDCYPDLETRFMGEFTFEKGLQVFREEVPMGEKTYRKFRWGNDLEIWLVEGRDFRSPNPMPDGPQKTIWGEEQMEWFKNTVKASDATFKILISPTPVVGPDRRNKNDNHANEGFAYEGQMLREFISAQENMVVVCGDRHWQYVSKDSATGLMEFGCGPGSDKHAGGWDPNDKRPEHQYLRVGGGGMEGLVYREDGQPKLSFRHYNPDGRLLNEYIIDQK